MLKLLKYDLLRNAKLLLSILTVTLVLQTGIECFARQRHWPGDPTIVLMILIYAVVMVGMLVITCRTYAFNMKSYQRRLLPLPFNYSTGSSLMFGFLTTLTVYIIVGLHWWISSWVGPSIGFEGFGSLGKGMDWSSLHALNTFEVIGGLLYGFWTTVFLLLSIFFAITISESLHFKGRQWIGIFMFFVFWGGVSWLESIWFGTDTSQIEASDQSVLTILDFSAMSWKPLMLELFVSVLIFYAISLLLEKRVEI